MQRIPHSRPTLPSAEEWPEVTARLAPGWAADGPCTRRFGAEAAEWMGCGFGTAVNSGTSALHLALLAVSVRPGSEVLVPAYCCAALLNAVALAGAVPVLVDSEAGGCNASPEDAARKVTPRTAAIIVAHMFGEPARTDAFLSLGTPVVEDCAQSLGAVSGGRPTGSRGSAAISSFYATKVITTGHGGLVATSDPEIDGRAKDLTHYDNRDDWRPRFNYGLGEPAAALGLWQLERLPGFLHRRAELRALFDAAVGRPAPPEGSIAYRWTIRVEDAGAAIDWLQERGIDAKRPVWTPLHHYLGGDAPYAQAAHHQVVSLPIYPTLTDGEAEHIAGALRDLPGRSLLRKCGFSLPAEPPT